jgi:hypothetical protein
LHVLPGRLHVLGQPARRVASAEEVGASASPPVVAGHDAQAGVGKSVAKKVPATKPFAPVARKQRRALRRTVRGLLHVASSTTGSALGRVVAQVKAVAYDARVTLDGLIPGG